MPKPSDTLPTSTQGSSSLIQNAATNPSTSPSVPTGSIEVINNQQSSQTISSTGVNSQTIIQGNSQPQQQIIAQKTSSGLDGQTG